MPYEGEQPLTAIEMQARGLLPPGPLSPPMNPNTPTVNEKAISDQAVNNVRQIVEPQQNPAQFPQMIGQGIQRGLGAVEGVLGKARAATSRGMVPSFVPENSSLRTVADLVNPVPGTLPQAAGLAASLPLGGGLITGPLKRAAAGGLAAAGTAAAMGKDPLAEGGMFAGQQLLGELPAAGMRLGAYARSAGKANSAYEAALANREKQIGFNKGMHEAITGAEQGQYKTDVANAKAQFREAQNQRQRQIDINEGFTKALEGADQQGFKQSLAEQKAQYAQQVAQAKAGYAGEMQRYSEEGAKSVADAFKAQVPAWKDYPSDTKGLLDMVYGKGQRDLSARYDEALKGVIEQGRGQEIPIPVKDATSLGMKPQKFVEMMDKSGIQYALVDAGDLAKNVTGRWKDQPDVYRRVANALDRAGIGDPAARAEYKAAQGLIQFADRSKMLQGETFNPQAAQKAFTSLKIIDELRRRGQGNIFEGPLSEAVRQGKPGPLQLPQEPSPLQPPPPRITPPPPPEPQLQMPQQPDVRIPPPEPPMPQKPDIRTRQIAHPWALGAGAVELPLMMAGHHGYGMPAVMGGMLGQMAIPKELVTRAPISQGAEMGLRLTAGEINQILKNLLSGQAQQGPLAP